MMIAAVIAMVPAAVSAGEHATGVLVVLAPTQEPAILEALNDVARDRTRVRFTRAANIEQIEACPVEERLACWTRIVDGELPSAEYAIVLAVHRAEGADRLSILAFDLRVARQVFRDVSIDRDAIEDRIFATAIQVPPADVDSALALRVYFERTFEALRPILAADFEPLGRIEVTAPKATIAILDDQTLGPVEDGLIEDVRPGRRTLELRAANVDPVSFTIEVRPGKTSDVALEIVAPVERPPILEVSLLTAGGAAVVGAAIAIGVAIAESGEVRSACLARDMDSDCPRAEGVSTSFDPSAAPTTDLEAVNPNAVSLPVLGVALATAGAAWITGALLFFDEEPLRLWLTFGAGLALAALSYGVGAAAGL